MERNLTDGEKRGTIALVSKTGGIKLIGEDIWLNPSDAAKENILDNIDELKATRGKEVLIKMAGPGVYKSIQAIDPEPSKEALREDISVKEETVQDNKESLKIPENKPESILCTPDKQFMHPSKHIEINGTFTFEARQSWDPNYFNKLSRIVCETDKKNNLTYTSWAVAWSELKKVYPDATFHVHENSNGMPYFSDPIGAFAKVSVTVCGITNTVHLPVMDYKNDAMKTMSYSYKKYDSYKKQDVDVNVKGYTAFDINKTIQRALAKAIAMHGLGIYVYKGEDLPSE